VGTQDTHVANNSRAKTAVPVYLIAGAAGAGKTTVAAVLASGLGISWLQADSTWLALKSATTLESHPTLRFFPELEGTSFTFDEFDARFRDGSAIVCAALEAVLAHELESRPEGFALEGTWLAPEWLAALPGRFPAADIRAVLLWEGESAEVQRVLLARSNHGSASPSQITFADLAWRIGERLRSRAAAAGIPVVAARPRETLLERVAAALEIA